MSIVRQNVMRDTRRNAPIRDRIVVGHRMWASCRIISEAHILPVGSFKRFQSEQLNTRIIRTDEHHLRISVRPPTRCSPDQHIYHSHHVIKALVLALNVGSMGNFYWENGPWAHPILSITDNLDGADSQEVALIAESPPADLGQLRPFSDMDEYRVTLLFGVFARGSAHVLENEYCRGLLLHRMQFCEIDFRRDAFMCFYRVLEHFVTRRVLSAPRLQNELKEIQLCIRSLGFGDALVDEMRELYVIRSSQTAHAQNAQRLITGDEVLKMKLYTDALLFRTLFAEANDIMEANFGYRSDG